MGKNKHYDEMNTVELDMDDLNIEDMDEMSSEESASEDYDAERNSEESAKRKKTKAKKAVDSRAEKSESENRKSEKQRAEKSRPEKSRAEKSRAEKSRSERTKPEKPKKSNSVSPAFILISILCFVACFGVLFYMQYQAGIRNEELLVKIEDEKESMKSLSDELKGQKKQIEELVRNAKEEKDEYVDLNSMGRNFYQKLKHGQDVRILIVGDSIGNGDGASNEAHKWENLLKDQIEEEYHSKVEITNVSMGGTTSFAGFARVKMLPEDENYDLAIICYGQNDDEENFGEYYESIIQELLKKYDGIELISILESAQKEYTSKMETIKWICGAYSIPVADTIGAFNASEIPYAELVSDGVHPNDTGHEIYEEVIFGVIHDKLVKNRLTEWNLDSENATYYALDQFERIDDTTWKASVSAANGRIGIYRNVLPGEAKIKVTIDDGQEIDLDETWPLELKKPDFYEISKDSYEIAGSVTIQFDSKDSADNFLGMLIVGL